MYTTVHLSYHLSDWSVSLWLLIEWLFPHFHHFLISYFLFPNFPVPGFVITHLPRVVCTVFGFTRWSPKHSSRCQYIYETEETLHLHSQCCASADWRWEESVADKSFSRSRRSTTAQAVITQYALPLEGFWTNPLVVVGEAPCLSQTGYKAYTYSPLADLLVKGHMYS